MAKQSGVLYISSTGMMEPLGQSQVLAYLEVLVKERPIHLISYEKPDDWQNIQERHAVNKRMERAGIIWHPLRYHNRPRLGATIYDILAGFLLGWRLVRRHHLAIIHARSYFPALSACLLSAITRRKFIFDIRGFWVDERADTGRLNRKGLLYKTLKYAERKLFTRSDAIVSLTHAGKREIQRQPYMQEVQVPIRVIPTCVDHVKFHHQDADKSGSFIFGHVGNVESWYLFDETLAFFRLLKQKRPDATLHVINRGAHDYIFDRLKAHGIPAEGVTVKAAQHHEMCDFINQFTVGSALIRPLYSKIASAPTKMAEYLACGVPMLGNSGVGDVEEILHKERVGIALADFTESSLQEGVSRLLTLLEDPHTAARCVAAAQKYFTLEQGAKDYAEIYRKLSS
jgi:glycosyltransferase involved in cell wall biosynthesis